MYAGCAGTNKAKIDDESWRATFTQLSVENATSFQWRRATETWDVQYELLAERLLRELAAKGVRGRV